MKIIHVSHCYHPSKGGVQWFFKNVSERLVRNYADDVTVVTTDSMYGPERLKYKKIKPQTEIINGVKVVRFAYTRWHILPLRWIIKLFGKLSIQPPQFLLVKLYGPLSKSMKKYLLQVDADAICAGSSNYYYMQLPSWKKTNFLYFGSIHLSEDPAKPVLTSIQKKSIQASKYYLANTNFEKERLIDAGIERNKIKVIGVGVDEKLFAVETDEISTYRSSLNISKNAMVIGYVGRIERTKNIRILIDAFAMVAKNDANIYLLIAGAGGDYLLELKQYTISLPENVQSQIIWKIDFDLTEKSLLFHNIDILVLPSNNESFGIVFLEAWVCKKPVIGSDIGAVRNVISENVDGLLMKINDKENLASKISILVKDKSLRDLMGEAGYNKVMNNYTWDIITRKMRDAYLENYIAN